MGRPQRCRKRACSRMIMDCYESPEEVSSIGWDSIRMSEQEQDLIYRMYRLVGESFKSCSICTFVRISQDDAVIGINRAITIPPRFRWELIAGRIPGRKAEEIERFWVVKNSETVPRQKSKLEDKGLVHHFQ